MQGLGGPIKSIYTMIFNINKIIWNSHFASLDEMEDVAHRFSLQAHGLQIFCSA
jgi:hypothetical protein